jgi:hypothetical protein
MGVDHGGFDITMPEQLLNCRDIRTTLKEMRDK